MKVLLRMCDGLRDAAPSGGCSFRELGLVWDECARSTDVPAMVESFMGSAEGIVTDLRETSVDRSYDDAAVSICHEFGLTEDRSVAVSRHLQVIAAEVRRASQHFAHRSTLARLLNADHPPLPE